MGNRVYNPQKWKSGVAVASTVTAAAAFASAALITMRYPIVETVNKSQTGALKSAISLLSSTESQQLFKRFNANNLLDLRNSLTPRQISSFRSIISTQKGTDALKMILTNSELTRHLHGIISINPEGIKIIQQILNNKEIFSFINTGTFKVIFQQPETIRKLAKILSQEKTKSLLFGYLSGKTPFSDLPKIFSLFQNNEVLKTALQELQIEKIFNNQQAINALKDIIQSPEELGAFKAILTATEPNSELFKNLINAQALNVQPTVAPSSYLGLMLAALVLVMVIAIIGTILTTLNNHNKIENKKSLTKKDMMPNMVCAGLLGVSLVGTALFVILEMEKFQALFKTPVMQNHAIMGGSVIGLMALALVLGVVVTTLCVERLTSSPNNQLSDLSAVSSINTVDDSLYAEVAVKGNNK